LARGGALLAALCLGHPPAAAVEAVSLPSLDGKLALPGYWFAADAAGRRPAVILLHGCGGTLDENGRLLRSRPRVAEFFNVEKMHLLVLDSFTPRGEKSICATPLSKRRIRYEDRRDDVFAAMQWLSRQPIVDQSRIALLGYSNGASVVLSALDRTDKAVQAQPLRPGAGIAFYPQCADFVQMWRSYEIAAPLLVMIGDLDELTPADECVRLQGKVKRAQPDASFDLMVFAGAHHGFDGAGPVRARGGFATRTGQAMVGGNPAARAKSHQRMFEFLSLHFGVPLGLAHDDRLYGHRQAVPPESGFAKGDDVAAVPLDENGRERYRHYLGLPVPKAFAITEKGRSYYASDDAAAMRTLMGICRDAKVKCWLYAVNERVVWSEDAAARIDEAWIRKR
jgi:dienelactone hydrolase